MSHYRPYSAYKDSDVEWLGRVPEHWGVMRFCDLCEGISTGPFGTALGSDSYVTGGIPVINPSHIVDDQCCPEDDISVSEVTAASLQFWAMRKGDLVTARRGELGRAAILTEKQDGWICGTGSLRVRPVTHKVVARYLHTVLQSRYAREWLNLSSVGATMANLNESILGQLPVSSPGTDEQRAILKHLDYETARIDALVEKKARFIELLREKRQALITHAVTKGLDPNVKMKDSGVEWLGEVPEHWGVAPMKYICGLLKDGTHLPPPRVDGGVPLLSVRNIVDGHLTMREDDSTISYPDYLDLCRAFTPKEGDVLLAVVGATLGKTALIPQLLGDFHIQRSLAIFRPKPERMMSSWLHMVFQSSLFQSLLWEHAGYSAQPGIYLGSLAGFPVPQPPLCEQFQILGYLSEQVSRLNSLIDKSEHSVSLLKERRCALITAAVTGQIDLREAV